MSRQRTISDRNFWHSPAMVRANCTTEDKVALLHLLTCPDSNVIGAYPLMPRIAGAELGWTPDQWLQVMDRLTAADLALYDPDRMFVWVKVWWEHHRSSQVMGPKLRRKTLGELRLLPEPWLGPYLRDFRERLEGDHRDALDLVVEIPSDGADDVSIPYPYGIGMVSNSSSSNSNANSSNKVTPTPCAMPNESVDNFAIPLGHRPLVEAAISKAQKAGVARVNPQLVRSEIARRYKSGRPPRDVAAYAFSLSKQMSETTQDPYQDDPSESELADWAWRCFCWPVGGPTNFIRIMEGGLFEHCFLDGEKWRRGHAHIGRSEFLGPLREGALQEVDPSKFDEVARRKAC